MMEENSSKERVEKKPLCPAVYETISMGIEKIGKIRRKLRMLAPFKKNSKLFFKSVTLLHSKTKGDLTNRRIDLTARLVQCHFVKFIR